MGETILAKAQSYKNEGICVAVKYALAQKDSNRMPKFSEKKCKYNIFEKYI